MAFSGNNQTIFNQAFNGYMAGALSGRPIADTVAADYSSLVTSGLAFAQEVDANIPTDAELSTGAGGTTIAPAAGAAAANAYAKSSLMFSLCLGYWQGRLNNTPDPVATDYLSIALAIKAAYVESVAGYASAPGGSSLT
jgi:hypothetical protein